MAQIIDFHSVREARPIREVLPTGDAEILFFLGVRYERMTDVAPPSPEPGNATGHTRKTRKRRA